MSQQPILRNPQLDGSPFYWKAGPIGVLLCHGFTATTTEVRLLAQKLFLQGYSVNAPLLPGHGTTPEDCNRYSWQDWYSSVEQSYQRLKADCEKVIVGGESAGALLSLRLAALHPEIQAILCYAPAIRLRFNPAQIFFLSLLAPFITSIPKAPPQDDNPWKGYAVQPLKAASQFMHLQKVIYPLLPQIRQPILILQGRQDPTVHPQAPQIVFDRVSSSIKELHWLENSTHCVILDKEHDFAANLTLDFLKRLLT